MKKSISLLLAVMMVCLLAFSPVSAHADYTPLIGGDTDTVTFNKYLVMKEEANVPNVTFTYSIAAGAAVAADLTNHKAAVLAGPVVESGGVVTAPTVGSAAFTTSDTKATTVTAGEDMVTLDSGEAYVKKPVTINFKGCTFDEPGIYRYVLTENETVGAMGTTYDTQVGPGFTAKTRYVDVYVVDDNGTLEVAWYVIHKDATAPTVQVEEGNLTTVQANKSDGFVNEYATQNLTFSKTVTGNQGSKDKYFKFTVAISGAVAGTKYTVDVTTHAEAASGNTSATKPEYRAQTNVQELTVGDNGTVTQAFYLKHGQSITIKGLATGTKVTVSEDNEDYAASYAIGTADAVSGAAAPEQTIAAADITIAFTNNRTVAVPTGVMLTVVPGVVIVAIAIAALILLNRRKKEDKD